MWRISCRVAHNRGRTAGIRALAGDTTALEIIINIMFTYMQEQTTEIVQKMFTILKKWHLAKMYCAVILFIPLGSRHHLGHSTHKVFVCDNYGADIKDKFLWWRVDLRVATSQCTQGCLWTHSFDVCSTISWQRETDFYEAQWDGH